MKLIPAIVRDATSGEILTLAYMTDEALHKTTETGETWFWSRSRKERWRKGDTSGDRQFVRTVLGRCMPSFFSKRSHSGNVQLRKFHPT